MLYNDDCLNVLPTLDLVDSIVTDPPYGLKFMGADWDVGVPGKKFWEAILDAAKPGAHLLAFGGTRTFHRLMCAIEDAGWELRDTIMWVYGSGFPKSHDVSKAIDRVLGAEREVVGEYKAAVQANNCGTSFNASGADEFGRTVAKVTVPSTDEAKQWNGWGTALKPAWEPIILARKPLEGTVANNVLTHGVGGLNIGKSRIGIDEHLNHPCRKGKTHALGSFAMCEGGVLGRWPANVIHDGSDEVVELFPDCKGPGVYTHSLGKPEHVIPGMFNFGPKKRVNSYANESGSAARFFYCAKASKQERGTFNDHPTVKPITLLEYLCRLITPPGGTVLDPFCGSGSTGLACMNLDFEFIGIEKDWNHYETARNRLLEHCDVHRALERVE